MILYRYLKSHAYETLRDAMFMVSPPGKFNDCLDCVAKVASAPTKEVLDNHYNHEKDWFGLASSLGLSADELLEVLNFPHKSPTPDRYKEVLQNNFLNHTTTDKVFRILCLCDSNDYPATDLHMWRKYAGNCGVRIGLRVDLESTKKQFVFRQVKYEDEIPKIELAQDANIHSNFDFLGIISTKTKKWAIEREWRLCLSAKDCLQQGGKEFLRWGREMLVSVDIGEDMNIAAQKGLYKMVRRLFPADVQIHRMNPAIKFSSLSYVEIPKCWIR